MIVVAGPRIDPASLPDADGLEVRPYVHDLYRHLAACDLAVVQGGLTTSMELTANRRPFLYFPLKHHFEQSFHVRHRLDRYGAGRCMDFDESEPDGHRRGDRGGDRPRGRLPAGRDRRRAPSGRAPRGDARVRAAQPDETGTVRGIYWERFGDGEPTVLFVPPWAIVHSRIWKMQVPYFARHFRVVVFDPRGNGRSERPSEPGRLLGDRVRRGHARGHGRERHRRSGGRVALAGGPALAAPRRRSPRARARPGLHRSRGTARARPPDARALRARLRGGARHRRGLGEAERALLAARFPRLPRVLLLQRVHRAALDQAGGGRGGVGRWRPTPRRSSRRRSRTVSTSRPRARSPSGSAARCS